jgi:hypothetical protein
MSAAAAVALGGYLPPGGAITQPQQATAGQRERTAGETYQSGQNCLATAAETTERVSRYANMHVI